MATAAFHVATDMRTFAGYDFSSISGTGASGFVSDTSYAWDYNSGFYNVITGSGFDFLSLPSQGTVNSWDFGVWGRVPNPTDPFNPLTQHYSYWTFSGLSEPAAQFSDGINGTGAELAGYISTVLAGNDVVKGSDYGDYLLAYEGADKVYGYAGNDSLDGGNGNDILDGGLGSDTMYGGAGNDVYWVQAAGDAVSEAGGDGIDIVKSSISYLLGTGVENLLLTGTAAIGRGNELNNVITGDAVANVLRGYPGNDVLKGGDGDDTLYGGTGKDSLYGNAGADTFVFDSTLNAATNVDKLIDFSVADDTVALDDDIFTAAGAVGTLASAAFFTGSAAHDASDRIIYNSATGNIYYDDDGTGADAQVLFAHVTAGTALTFADFSIVG